MKNYLDIANWPRKEHFDFFRAFDEPFFGATVRIDCTGAYAEAKKRGLSFFAYYLFQSLRAANEIEPFRYRMEEDRILIHDRIDASATIARNDGSFGFSLIEFCEDLDHFSALTEREIERVQAASGLLTREFPNDNLIHFSSIPWLDFTSLSHARNYSVADSCPKISVGKMTVAADGSRSMPVSVHVHHGLMDGYHVAQFFDRFQQLMN